MIKAVIFDMDGLMFDSELLGLQMIQEVMKDYPYDYDEDLNMRVIGTNEASVEKEYLRTYGPDFPYQEVMEKKHQKTIAFYEEHDIPKKEGLVELLQFLKEQQIKLAVATSTDRANAEYMLKKAEIFHYFDEMVCGDEVLHSKPDPEIFETALQKLAVMPHEAFVLEDSENGLRAAHSAGISTVFVKDLITPKEDVLVKVTHSAATLHDVIEMVTERNKTK